MTQHIEMRQRVNLRLYLDKPKGKCPVCGKQLTTNAFYLKHDGKVIAKTCSFDCRQKAKRS